MACGWPSLFYRPVPLKPAERFPSLLEYLPYRKDDDEAVRDFGTHMYSQARLCGARVDIADSARARACPPNREYSAQEQQDAEAVIAWLAANRGRTEKSHARNFLGRLQFHSDGAEEASRTKAILAVAATEELFKEDVHYMDGVFHVDEFELTMDLDQGRCGAPDFSLDEPVIGPRMESPPWFAQTT